MHWKVPSKRFRGWVLWTLATGISWAIIVFPGLNMRNTQISSWNMIPSVTFNILLGSMILGTFVGLTQYLVLLLDVHISVWWLPISIVSYAIGIPLGFVLATTGIGAINPQALSSTGKDFMMMPLAMTMLLGGTFAGVIQAFVLRKGFLKNKGRKTLLWALGNSFGWSFGFFASSIAWGWNMPVLIQSAIAGIIIGSITGVLLLVIIEKA